MEKSNDNFKYEAIERLIDNYASSIVNIQKEKIEWFKKKIFIR